MEYRNVLLNERAYRIMSVIKSRLSAERGARTTFSGIIEETIGRELRFAAIDEGLKGYIDAIAGALSKDEHVLGVMLFGSVAKSTYKQHSDIDILIVASDDASKRVVLERLWSIEHKKDIDELGMRLFERGLPSSIGPLLLSSGELERFRPIYLDMLDYGITLYDCNNTVSKFLNRMRDIKHWREAISGVEVLRWKM